MIIRKIKKQRPTLILLSILIITAAGCGTPSADTSSVSTSSPDGNIVFTLKAGLLNERTLNYSVNYKERAVILPSSFKIQTSRFDFTHNLSIVKVEEEKVSNEWENRFGEKSLVPDNYNQLTIYLKNQDHKFNILCRVYNEGVAFSYYIPEQEGADSIIVTSEDILFNFPDDYFCWATYTAQGIYKRTRLSDVKPGAERPLVIEYDSLLTVALAEAKLVDYARMKLAPDSLSGHSLRTILDAPVAKDLPFQSPWRVIMMAENAGKLLEQNYLIQNLNDPSAIENAAWIKPGKAIRDVTLTTRGGKTCIDFASEHGMQYVEFDAGWYGPENAEASDATAVSLDPARSEGPFDLEEIIRYAKSKGIGIILYVNRRALEKQLDKILPLYKAWGVAGIKYGFVRVGDQESTRWLHDAVKKAADYGFIVDVHDEYRPTGFSRTYPNLLTQEGIRGDEESVPNSHTLITMFTRMLAGAADNTVCYYAERVTDKMGSHASQLAKGVCLASPLQFLYWYDRPASPTGEKGGSKTSLIGNEPELAFFDELPTTWDETKVLHAKISEYAVIARKKGNEWFLGGINNEEKRSVTVNFGFLDKGKQYNARIYSDDSTVNTRTHVRIDEIRIDSNSGYTIDFGAGNGIAMHLIPEK